MLLPLILQVPLRLREAMCTSSGEMPMASRCLRRMRARFQLFQ